MTDTGHMTDEWQFYSAFIFPVVILGVWALVGLVVRDIRKRDEIEAIDLARTIQRHSIAALAGALFIDRDQHPTDVRDEMRRCRR